MSVKRLLKQNEMRKKEMGMVFPVPLLVVFLVLPAWLYAILGNDLLKSYEKYRLFLSVTEAVLPFFSVFWIVLSAYDWVESDGWELYYLYEKKPDRAAGFYAGVFQMLLLVSYLFYGYCLKGFFYEYFRIASICLFFQGLAMCLLYLLRSQVIAYFLVFLYILYSGFTYINGDKGIFCYLNDMPKSMGEDYFRAGCFLVLGSLFWIVGAMAGRGGRRFSR